MEEEVCLGRVECFFNPTYICEGKFLGTPEAQRNDALSSHIYDRPHQEFNE